MRLRRFGLIALLLAFLPCAVLAQQRGYRNFVRDSFTKDGFAKDGKDGFAKGKRHVPQSFAGQLRARPLFVHWDIQDV